MNLPTIPLPIFPLFKGMEPGEEIKYGNVEEAMEYLESASNSGDELATQWILKLQEDIQSEKTEAKNN